MSQGQTHPKIGIPKKMKYNLRNPLVHFWDPETLPKWKSKQTQNLRFRSINSTHHYIKWNLARSGKDNPEIEIYQTWSSLPRTNLVNNRTSRNQLCICIQTRRMEITKNTKYPKMSRLHDQKCYEQASVRSDMDASSGILTNASSSQRTKTTPKIQLRDSPVTQFTASQPERKHDSRR